MKVHNLLRELKETQPYKTFKQQNPSTFFSACFFILDTKNQTEQKCQVEQTNSKETRIRGALVPGIIQLDFFLPSHNKIASFEHPYKEPKIHDDKIETMQPQTTDIKIDIDELEQICKKIIKEKNSLLIPTKIIAILKDDIWNLTCMDDMLGIIRIKINAITSELQDFNKGSLMDFMEIKKN